MSEQQAPIEEQAAAMPPAAESLAAATPNRLPTIAVAFVILALLGALIGMNLRHYIGRGTSAESREILQLQAEANALRARLKIEPTGTRPLEGDSEPVEQLAARMKKDADTMAALAASFQGLLADKDRELSAKSAELLHADQRAQAFETERKHLQDELDRARAGVSAASDLPEQLAKAQTQRDALLTELESARRELAAKAQAVPADDVADLKRQLDEAQRAKEFFEAKLKEHEPASKS